MVFFNMLTSALMQGFIYAPMALGVFIAFRILNTPDLTIDGSLVFGMTTCAVVTIAGHPILGLFAGLIAGAAAGFITGILQTRLKINPILAGILTMTGLYTVNYAILGSPNQYLQYAATNAAGGQVFNACDTVYQSFSDSMAALTGLSLFADPNFSAAALSALIVLLLTAVMIVFFKTRAGIAIRATGNNEEMVRSSSINADRMRVISIMLANALVGLSGAMLCQQQRYADLNCGSGMLVMGLASVIIGQVLFGNRGITAGIISAAAGSLIYRFIIQVSYKIDMPSYMVKLLSALIVVISLSVPVLRRKLAEKRGQLRRRKEYASETEEAKA